MKRNWSKMIPQRNSSVDMAPKKSSGCPELIEESAAGMPRMRFSAMLLMLWQVTRVCSVFVNLEGIPVFVDLEDSRFYLSDSVFA